MRPGPNGPARIPKPPVRPETGRWGPRTPHPGAGAAAGQNRGARDKPIAAHALALDVTLVTHNERDFEGYPGLRVEHWVSNH